MIRRELTNRLIKGGLLALGIGVLGFIIWIQAEHWQPNPDKPVQDRLSVPNPERATEQVMRVQPTETAQASQVTGSATPATTPDFTLPALSGELISLSDYAGKPVLINFWATWCPPCRIEMPAIQHVFDEQDGAFVVLAVNLEETHAVIQPFVDELGLTFPILLDSDGLVTWQYRVLGLPTSVFVTPEGTIYEQYIGPMDETFIKEMLAEMSKGNRTSGESDVPPEY